MKSNQQQQTSDIPSCVTDRQSLLIIIIIGGLPCVNSTIRIAGRLKFVTFSWEPIDGQRCIVCILDAEPQIQGNRVNHYGMLSTVSCIFDTQGDKIIYWFVPSPLPMAMKIPLPARVVAEELLDLFAILFMCESK